MRGTPLQNTVNIVNITVQYFIKVPVTRYSPVEPEESNVFKPAVFTPFSLVFEQHLRASRALNPLPTRTDALKRARRVSNT